MTIHSESRIKGMGNKLESNLVIIATDFFNLAIRNGSRSSSQQISFICFLLIKM